MIVGNVFSGDVNCTFSIRYSSYSFWATALKLLHNLHQTIGKRLKEGILEFLLLWLLTDFWIFAVGRVPKTSVFLHIKIHKKNPTTKNSKSSSLNLFPTVWCINLWPVAQSCGGSTNFSTRGSGLELRVGLQFFFLFWGHVLTYIRHYRHHIWEHQKVPDGGGCPRNSEKTVKL